MTHEPRLAGKTVALLSAPGAHEHEFWVPYYRFREEGAKVLVCGAEAGVVYQGEGRHHGTDGLDLAPTKAAVADVDPDEMDALIIPGGMMGPMYMRAHGPTLDLVRAMDERGKPIGAICHGPWVLVSADVLRGRRATGPGDIAVDMRNAGAEFVNEDVVRDGHIITAVYFGHLPWFLRELIDAITD